MGAVQPGMALAGERPQITWPEGASWGGLEMRCVLGDGSECASDRWSALDSGTYHAGCGPVQVTLGLRPTRDGTARLEARASASPVHGGPGRTVGVGPGPSRPRARCAAAPRRAARLG